MDAALIALIGTVCGGAGLKIIEHVLGRTKNKDDLAASLRAELRADIDRLRTELKDESTDADTWQARYWELKASTLIANSKADALINEVEERHPESTIKNDLKPLMNHHK